jgi:Protein of unknown function (DUF3040)
MGPQDDSSLTASERDALAPLEADAAARDPLLARRLRGSSRLSVIAPLCRVRRSGRPGWWGASLILVGLTLVAMSLSTAWFLGVVGSLITTWGLWMLAGAVGRRLARGGSIGPA